jgi:hypothetical protein
VGRAEGRAAVKRLIAVDPEIAEVIRQETDRQARVAARVRDLCAAFPLYRERLAV